MGGAEVIKNLKDDDGRFDLKTISSSRMKNVAKAYGWWIAKDCCAITILKVILTCRWSLPRLLLIHPRAARRFHRAQTTNSEIPPRALRTHICCESGIIASADRRRQRTNVAQSRDGRRHFHQGDQDRKLGSWTDILPLQCVQRRGGIPWVGECVGKGDAADRDERDSEAITFASSLGRLPKRDVPRSRFIGVIRRPDILNGSCPTEFRCATPTGTRSAQSAQKWR